MGDFTSTISDEEKVYTLFGKTNDIRMDAKDMPAFLSELALQFKNDEETMTKIAQCSAVLSMLLQMVDSAEYSMAEATGTIGANDVGTIGGWVIEE